MNPWLAKEREKNGVEVIVAEFPDWLFRVRRADKWNAEYHRELTRISMRRDVRALIERQRADDYEPTRADMDLDAKVSREAFAAGCVVGWSGVTGRDGKALPFTVENAVAVLATFPEVAEALLSAAANPANFGTPNEDEKASAVLGNFDGASSSSADRGAKHSPRARSRTAGEKERPS